MAVRPTLVMRVILVLLTIVAIVWQCLMISACVPRTGGSASVLSNFHIMELSNSTRTVRFGYMGFCTSVSDSPDVPPVQVCNGLNSLVSPSPDAVQSKLPNLDPNLFELAFSLNQTAFPRLPVITLFALVFTAAFLIAHCVVKPKNLPVTKLINYNIFVLLTIATTLSMISAANLTMVTTTIATQLRVTNSDFASARGRISFILHWATFALVTFVAIASLITLRKAQPKSSSKSRSVPVVKPETGNSATQSIDTFDAESVYSQAIDTKFVPNFDYDPEKDNRVSTVMAYWQQNPNCFADINKGRFDADSYSVYATHHPNGLHRANSIFTQRNGLHRANSNFSYRNGALRRNNSVAAPHPIETRDGNGNVSNETPISAVTPVNPDNMALVPVNTIGPDDMEKFFPRTDVGYHNAHDVNGRFSTTLHPDDIQTRYVGVVVPTTHQNKLQRNVSTSNVSRLSSKYSSKGLRSSSLKQSSKYNLGTNTVSRANSGNPSTNTNGSGKGDDLKARYYSGVAYDVDLRHSMAGR